MKTITCTSLLKFHHATKISQHSSYKLLTFDDNGKAIADRALDIIEGLKYPQMTVIKDGKLVIYCHEVKSTYICESTNGEKDYKFPLPLKNVRPDDVEKLSLTVSDQNDIVFTFSKRSNEKYFFIHIITMDGKLRLEVQVSATTKDVYYMNVVFNHVNKTILVSLHVEDSGLSSTFYDTSLFSVSKTGERLYKLNIPEFEWSGHDLISHPKGPIALVGGNRIIMLQM